MTADKPDKPSSDIDSADSARPRVVIIGAGLMGRWHAFTANKSKAAVVAIVDPDIVAAGTLAKKYDATAFATLAALVQSGLEFDLAHICTPSDSHEAILTGLIEAGKGALVEKPFALDGDATRRLLALATKRGVKVCPVHQFAFQRSVEAFKARPERVGELVSVEFRFATAGASGMDASDWPTLAADILPHPLSVLQRLFEPLALSQADWRIVPVGEGSWDISAVIEGVMVRIWISVVARPTEASMVVQGSAGSYSANLFHDYGVWHSGRVSRLAKMTAPLTSSLQQLGKASVNLVARFVRGEPAYPGLARLVADFYAGEEQDLPISHAQIQEVATVRDRFLGELREAEK